MAPSQGKTSHRHHNTAVILYPQFTSPSPQDTQDVQVDVDLISKVLEELGYSPVSMPATLDLTALIARLRDEKPLFVFNLVDSLQDKDQLIQVVPQVLDAFHIPFTGVNARGHFLTTDKILAKEMLQLAGIATPPWRRADEVLRDGTHLTMPCILKPVATDASFGMDEHSVCADEQALRSRIQALAPEQRVDHMAEEFVDGREFNVSAMGMADGVRILPAAEMTFEDYPPGKFKIVDFKAKWTPDSFEFQHTVRRFDFPETDRSLLEELRAISLRCWTIFGLTGYARVDFRVDQAGKPWVLEINGNPCISPDAGFVAAGERAGMNYTQLIGAIVDDALRRRPRQPDEEQKAHRRARRSVLDKKR